MLHVAAAEEGLPVNGDKLYGACMNVFALAIIFVLVLLPADASALNFHVKFVTVIVAVAVLIIFCCVGAAAVFVVLPHRHFGTDHRVIVGHAKYFLVELAGEDFGGHPIDLLRFVDGDYKRDIEGAELLFEIRGMTSHNDHTREIRFGFLDTLAQLGGSDHLLNAQGIVTTFCRPLEVQHSFIRTLYSVAAYVQYVDALPE